MARDYKREYALFHGKPDRIKERAQRNAARAKMVKEGAVKKGDGKDVGHKRAVASGGSNSRSNLRVEKPSANRARK